MGSGGEEGFNGHCTRTRNAREDPTRKIYIPEPIVTLSDSTIMNSPAQKQKGNPQRRQAKQPSVGGQLLDSNSRKRGNEMIEIPAPSSSSSMERRKKKTMMVVISHPVSKIF
jgi:hypothetical protein